MSFFANSKELGNRALFVSLWMVATFGLAGFCVQMAVAASPNQDTIGNKQPANRTQEDGNGSDKTTKQSDSSADRRMIIVLGTPGEDKYSQLFQIWADKWQSAANAVGIDAMVIGLGDKSQQKDDRTQFKNAIDESESLSAHQLWVVYVGHGTYDGKTAKLNLRGPDVTSAELKEWLLPIKAQLILIHSGSASGAFVGDLSGANRVVITATKSGYQYNFARFGGFIADAMVDPSIDLDKDGQTSLLEAFLAASKKTSEFYKSESRIATENALIEDNGDGKGTTAEFFEGIRVVAKVKGGGIPDGPRANQIFFKRSPTENRLSQSQRDQRDTIELKIEQLRSQKDDLTETDYYQQLEILLLEMAAIYVDND